MSVPNRCELCGFESALEKHHLIPQSTCRNKYKKLKNDEMNFLWICKQCHDQIHAFFTNNELRDVYNSKEALISNEKFNSYVKWRKRHLNYDFNSTKMSNRRKNK